MQKYYPPKHHEKQFHCIHCGVYSAQCWGKFFFNPGTGIAVYEPLTYCICVHCHKWSNWFSGRMIVPSETPIPPAHSDMPQACVTD